MNTRTLIIALTSLVLLAGLALADGGFYGAIDYRDCTCTGYGNGDLVKIQRVGYAQIYTFAVTCTGEDGYTTAGQTFPPGNYKIWVDLCEDSDCDKSLIQQVIHGSTNQEVNLIVLGKEGQPDGGGNE